MAKINRALMQKARQQSADRYAAAIYKDMAETPAPKSYRIKLKGGDSLEGVYTMDAAVCKLGPAIRAYELVEV